MKHDHYLIKRPFFKRMVQRHTCIQKHSFLFKHRTILAYWPWTKHCSTQTKIYTVFMNTQISSFSCPWGKETLVSSSLRIIPWIHFCVSFKVCLHVLYILVMFVPNSNCKCMCQDFLPYNTHTHMNYIPYVIHTYIPSLTTPNSQHLMTSLWPYLDWV